MVIGYSITGTGRPDITARYMIPGRPDITGRYMIPTMGTRHVGRFVYSTATFKMAESVWVGVLAGAHFLYFRSDLNIDLRLPELYPDCLRL